MAWEDLDYTRAPTTADVEDAFSKGILSPRPEWTNPGPPPSLTSDRTWRRTDYEAYVFCDELGVSIIPAERIMTRSLMETFALSPTPTPLDFRATHDIGVCPTRQVTLTWTNGTRSEQKVLEWSTDGVNWIVLSGTIGVGETSYEHGSNGPVSGSNFYRMRWASESIYTHVEEVGVTCPD